VLGWRGHSCLRSAGVADPDQRRMADKNACTTGLRTSLGVSVGENLVLLPGGASQKQIPRLPTACPPWRAGRLRSEWRCARLLFQYAAEFFFKAAELLLPFGGGGEAVGLPDEPLFPALLDFHRDVAFHQVAGLGGNFQPAVRHRFEQNRATILLDGDVPLKQRIGSELEPLLEQCLESSRVCFAHVH